MAGRPAAVGTLPTGAAPAPAMPAPPTAAAPSPVPATATAATGSATTPGPCHAIAASAGNTVSPHLLRVPAQAATLGQAPHRQAGDIGHRLRAIGVGAQGPLACQRGRHVGVLMQR